MFASSSLLNITGTLVGLTCGARNSTHLSCCPIGYTFPVLITPDGSNDCVDSGLVNTKVNWFIGLFAAFWAISTVRIVMGLMTPQKNKSHR
jgi:hypothetical protein